MKRRTIDLPDDVYRDAKSLANFSGAACDRLLSSPPARICFPGALPADPEPVTLEQTLAAEDRR